MQDAVSDTLYTGRRAWRHPLRRLIALAALVACTGTRVTSVEPAGEPEPDLRAEPDDPAQARPTAAPYSGHLAAVAPEVAGRLDPALVLEIRQAKGAFDSAVTSAQLAAAWRRAVALAPQLEAALQPAFEATDFDPMDLGWLKPSLPAMSETYMAEGMALVFALDHEPWAAKAATTPEPDDDAFFELMLRAWGSARALGWATWDQRTWDYGGCSGLGTGIVYDVLVQADKAKGPNFAAEVAETRRLAVAVITEDNPQFPRCSANTLEPMPTAALQREVGRILEDVALTADERAAIEKVLPTLQGQPHTGG